MFHTKRSHTPVILSASEESRCSDRWRCFANAQHDKARDSLFYAAVSASFCASCVSTRMPGPIVDETVIPRR